MILNIDAINNFIDELTLFEGYVPLRLYPYIDIKKRNEYLMKKGLYDIVNETVHQKKNEFRLCSEPIKCLHEDFINWVDDNPQFKELLI